MRGFFLGEDGGSCPITKVQFRRFGRFYFIYREIASRTASEQLALSNGEKMFIT